MKDIQSQSQFEASRRPKPVNEAEDVKAMQKRITDILVSAGYHDGDEFWFAGSRTIQCDGKQNAKLVCKTLQADDIECHVDKDIDVILEGDWTGKDDANTFRELGKREQLGKLADFLMTKIKEEHPYADGGSCVVIQESDMQPGDIQKHVDVFNRKYGSSYKVKPGEGRDVGDGSPKFVVEAMTSKDAVDETVIMKASAPKFDVTTSAKSIASRVTDLIGRMATMSFESIRSEFEMILKSGDTHASDSTRQKWLGIAAASRNKFSLMKSITDLYLAAANMKVDPNSY